MIDKSKSIYIKKFRNFDMVSYGLIYTSAAIAVAVLLAILIYVFANGLKAINVEFLTTVTSAVKGTTGIIGNIVNTVYIIILTLLISTPIGIGSAIYLTEYAKPGRIVQVIEFATEILAGIPSIIYGLFGMVFFGSTLGFQYSILTGSLTLTLMVLPLITRNTQEALKTVPKAYRSAALGLGTSKWYMIRTVLLPSAMPGIITGVILCIGRIVGESAALLFTAGSGYYLPKNGQWIEKIMQSGGTLSVQLYLSMSKGEYKTAFGIGIILLIIVFMINILTKIVSVKFSPKS